MNYGNEIRTHHQLEVLLSRVGLAFLAHVVGGGLGEVEATDRSLGHRVGRRGAGLQVDGHRVEAHLRPVRLALLHADRRVRSVLRR